jgi:three-Cys-motif partner protein
MVALTKCSLYVLFGNIARLWDIPKQVALVESTHPVAQAKFFDERTDQSEVKARIVEKYFYAWVNVIKGAVKKRGKKIAYIDLYAGPGRYKDGAASTPLLVLEHAVDDPDLTHMLVALFNDVDEGHTESLKGEISKIPGIEKLKYAPTVLACTRFC